MSTRTIIEINHDYIADLAKRPDDLAKWVKSLGHLSHVELAKFRGTPYGIRFLGQRHHSETLKLEVK